MREIKFRWRDTEDKKMYYDDFYCHLEPPVSINMLFVDDGSISKRGHYIPMQYTGLKDRNGKEIYEGDIISEYGKIRIVKYGYGEYDREGDTGDCAYGFNIHHNSNIEVIGNIYENPKLLSN